MLKEILEWVNKHSAPNESYKYSRCVICGHAWWGNNEDHNFDCWVPRLKEAVEHRVHPTYGELPASDVWTTPEDLPAPVVRLDPPISG